LDQSDQSTKTPRDLNFSAPRAYILFFIGLNPSF